MATLDEIRARHVPVTSPVGVGARPDDEFTNCAHDGQGWPCDTAEVLDLLAVVAGDLADHKLAMAEVHSSLLDDAGVLGTYTRKDTDG